MSPLNKSQLQKTIKDSFSISGIGIHSGKIAKIVVKPAPANTGIIFLRSGKAIKAAIENVTDTKLGTTLAGIKVVEHFLAAATGLEIDNLAVEVEEEELPILDGSALPYAQKLIEAQIIAQDAPKDFLEIKETIAISEENKFLKISPYHGFKVNFVVDYPVIGKQERGFEGGAEEFLREIAPARTFGFVENIEELRAGGFARGASLENALAISKNGYLNQPRFWDEPVRHKILDLIGDLSLLGVKILGEITAVGSSHKMNIELVKKIYKNYQGRSGYDPTRH